jgi:hypothetical protein
MKRRAIGAGRRQMGRATHPLADEHRRRQLQHDGRTSGLGAPPDRRHAEQEQQRQDKRSCRHRRLFRLSCRDYQTTPVERGEGPESALCSPAGGNDPVRSICPVISRTSQRLDSAQPRPRQAPLVSPPTARAAAMRNGAGSGADDFGLAHLRFPLMMTAGAADGRTFGRRWWRRRSRRGTSGGRRQRAATISLCRTRR